MSSSLSWCLYLKELISAIYLFTHLNLYFYVYTSLSQKVYKKTALWYFILPNFLKALLYFSILL